MRWPVRPMDIDPFRLPAKFNLPVKTVAGQLLRAQDRILIEPAAIAIEREVLGARATRKKVALREFSGVAIRAELVGENEDKFAVSVNLHHEDPELCIPLHMAFDTDEVNARWQSWAKALGLPLLMPAVDGGWREPVERLGKVAVAPAHARNPRKALAGRRSWMSAIREKSVPGPKTIISGAEIIARS